MKFEFPSERTIHSFELNFESSQAFSRCLLLSFCCISTKSICFSPWKFSTPIFRSPPTPGMWFNERNASPAKSFAVITSWSITVNAIIAFSWLHCSVVIVPNSKHSSNMGFSVRYCETETEKRKIRLLEIKVCSALYEKFSFFPNGMEKIEYRKKSFPPSLSSLFHSNMEYLPCVREFAARCSARTLDVEVTQ